MRRAARLGLGIVGAALALAPNALARAEAPGADAGRARTLLARLAVAGAEEEPRVLQELAGLGRQELRPAIAELAALAHAPGQRRKLLLALATCARGEDLELALSVAGAAAEDPRPDPAVQEGLERCASAALERDAATLERIERLLPTAPAALAPPLVRALGAEPSPERARSLADLLGFGDDLDVLLLGELGRMAPALERPVDEEVRRAVRRCTEGGSDRLLREAAQVAGRLGDFGAAERLTDLLAHPSEAVRKSAHFGLTAMSGLAFRADAERWRAWCALEQRWYEEQAPLLVAALASDEEPEVLGALEALARHRWEREALAREVATLLDHASPRVRERAAATLARLGLPSAPETAAVAARAPARRVPRGRAIKR